MRKSTGLALYLPRLALVVLNFPVFNDGRSFSLARQLRLDGYAGEIRATGNVMPDLLQFMLQVGFDTFDVSTRFSPELWLRSLRRISLTYQHGLADEKTPVGAASVWNDLVISQQPHLTIGRRPAETMQHLIAELSHLDGSALLQPLIEKHLRRQVALVSSFGTESVVLLHMVASIDANTPVIFIQTGKLFEETEEYRLKLESLFGLRDLRVVRAACF